MSGKFIQKLINNTDFWFIGAIVLNLAFLLLIFANMNHHDFGRMFFSSDKIYNSLIFNDVFIDKSGIKGWHLNGAPNFFPDMFLYFILMAVFRNVLVTDFVFVIIQYLAFLLLVHNLFRIVIGAEAKKYSTLFFLLNLLILFMPVFTNRFLITFNYMSISYHFGMVIMALASYNMLFAYLKDFKKNKLIWLIVLILLGTVSDRLYIIHFIIPSLALVVFFLKKEYFQELWLPTLSVLIIPATGIFLFRMIRLSKIVYIVHTGFKMFNFENISYAWERFIAFIGNTFRLYPHKIIYILGLLTFIAAIIFIIRNLILLYKGKELETKKLPFYLTVVFTAFIPVVLFTPVINGAFIGPAIIRFNFMGIGMGLILLPLLLMTWDKTRKISKEVLRYFLPLSSIAIAIVLFFTISERTFIPGLKEYFNYYPESAQVLDSLKDEHNLKCGLGGYWEAKKTMAYSKNDLRIYPTGGKQFKPSYHTTNEFWYHAGGKGKYKDPVFNFISIEALPHQDIVYDIFGNSMDTLFVNEDMLIVKVPEFRYEKGSKRIIFLNEPAD